MKSKNRKKLLCISAAVLILVAYTSKKKYHPNYKILNAENGPFATYSDGNVYIGNTDYLSSLKGLNPSDVLKFLIIDPFSPIKTIVIICTYSFFKSIHISFKFTSI